MATPEGKVPIMESVRAGWDFARKSGLRLIAPALVTALIVAGLNVWSLNTSGPEGGLGPMIGSLVGAAALTFVYAGYLRLSVEGRLGGLGGVEAGMQEAALFGAMIVVGFFLFIVVAVAAIPAVIFLVTLMAPYADALKDAQDDPAALNTVLAQVAQENAAALLLLALFGAFVWMALTSRLFLAAPASVASRRVRTFETWAWTKGNMLRIMAARLVALAPLALILMMVQSVLLGAVGAGGPTGPVTLAKTQPAILFAVSALIQALAIPSLVAIEAGLSAYLHKGLKPPSEP